MTTITADATTVPPGTTRAYFGRVAPSGSGTAALPLSADYIARSSGAGVVWAHAFETDAEVTQHLGGPASAVSTPVPVRRVVDESGLNCLEQIVLGAALTAPYTAGGTTVQIDDALHWPDPAATGAFSFILALPYPAAPTKNLFLCTARAGTNLTVQYVGGQDPTAFAATPQTYPIGSYAGNESAREWRRTFARLPAGENGKAADDPGASGAVPLRSRLAGNSNSVPRDASYFQYGWYGHPTNQTTWANWTPWVGAQGFTPRGFAQGAAAKYRLWDGHEFYIQFKCKIDARFMAAHQQVAPDANYWLRKAFAIQSEVSSLNQLVTDIGPSNQWKIPDTNKFPVFWSTYKDTRVLGDNDTPARPHRSHQLNGPWDVAPHYAVLSTGIKPSTGCPTPDGSAAFEYPDDEWVTFQVYCRPGRSGVAETLFRLQVARHNMAGYAGQYTMVADITDATIVYSGSGDYDFPDGAFTYPAVHTADALPGYQSFGLMGYLNLFLYPTPVPPKKSYYIRMAEVIFSQQPIPAPAGSAQAPALGISNGAWTPNRTVSGDVADTDWGKLPANTWVTVAGSNNKLRDVAETPEYIAQGGAFGDVVLGWSGGYFDYARKAMGITGGGHAGTFAEETGIYELLAQRMRFERIVNRQPSGLALRIPVSDPNVTAPHIMEPGQTYTGAGGAGGFSLPLSNGYPGTVHTSCIGAWVPPAVMASIGMPAPVRGGYMLGGITRAIINLDTGVTSNVHYSWKGLPAGNVTMAESSMRPSMHIAGTTKFIQFYNATWLTYDASQSEFTLWQQASQCPNPTVPSKGKLLPTQSFGAAIEHNWCLPMKAPQAGQLFVLHSNYQVKRMRMAASVSAGAGADVSGYVDTVPLTSSNGTDHLDFSAANVRGYQGHNLVHAGASYDAEADAMWVCANDPWNYPTNADGSFTVQNTNPMGVYRLTGIGGGISTAAQISVKKISGTQVLTSSQNGTFDRFHVVKMAGHDIAMRVTSVDLPIQICRLVPGGV